MQARLLHATAIPAPWPAQLRRHLQPQHTKWQAAAGGCSSCSAAADRAEALREVLQLPAWRFEALVARAPSVLTYEPDTLALTVAALRDALHTSQRGLLALLEARPGVLLAPHEPCAALQAAAALLGLGVPQAAALLGPHPHLLALRPAELAARAEALARLLGADSGAAAAAAAGGPSFLALLAAPLEQTEGRIAALADALQAPAWHVARLAAARPRLLELPPVVVASRVWVLAREAGDGGPAALLAGLDDAQADGLAALLLLSPGRLAAQLEALVVLLREAEQEGQQHGAQQQQLDQQLARRRTAVGLLLRLGLRTSLAEAQVMMTALRGLVRRHPPWRSELAAAGEVQLAALLSAGYEGLAQAAFLASSGGGGAAGVGWSLSRTLSCPAAQFHAAWDGAGYSSWLAGRVAV